jgi:hypothetical protein
MTGEDTIVEGGRRVFSTVKGELQLGDEAGMLVAALRVRVVTIAMVMSSHHETALAPDSSRVPEEAHALR